MRTELRVALLKGAAEVVEAVEPAVMAGPAVFVPVGAAAVAADPLAASAAMAAVVL